MAADQIRLYYDRTAPYYDLSRLPFLLGRRAGVELLGLQEGNSVLEIGAGTGHNLPAITSRIGSGSLTLLDFSVSMLRQARNKTPAGSRVACIAADARDLCTTTRFDRILLSYSLSLMPAPQLILQSALERLAENGILVIADFGDMVGWGPFRSIVTWWLGKHSVVPAGPHIREFASQTPKSDVCERHLGYTILARISA